MVEAALNRADCVGVDAGASLWKLVRRVNGAWESHYVDRGDSELVAQLCPRSQRPTLGLTGGGARSLVEALGGTVVPEFDAWAAGANQVMGGALPEVYLLVSVGTGAAILLVRRDAVTYVGGSPLAGGTLVGLGRLLTGAQSYDDVVALATRGDRSKIDLSVGDLYTHGDSPLPPSIPVGHFAKLSSDAPEDLAAALLGMIGRNLGLISGQLALSHGARLVVFGGSALRANPPLREALSQQTSLYGVRVEFAERGAFLGAIGAAELARRAHLEASPPR